jgi:hypothetical protein
MLETINTIVQILSNIIFVILGIRGFKKVSEYLKKYDFDKYTELHNLKFLLDDELSKHLPDKEKIEELISKIKELQT